MTKLIIQVPAYREEQTIGQTLDALPRHIPGIDSIEFLVIDDGSNDRTAEVARLHGAHHVVSLTSNQGLGRAFATGLDTAVSLGADIIVNTDADNQYFADDIHLLVEPILQKRADIVIGSRAIATIEEFSLLKKFLQQFGSYIVRLVSNVDVSDAPSGFRAFSRTAALKLHVFSNFSYTLETLIQAKRKGLAVQSVPIRSRAVERPSRLMTSMSHYIYRSALIIIRNALTHSPLRLLAVPALLLLGSGGMLLVRFFWYHFTQEQAGHIQSVIIAGILIGAGFFVGIMALLADLIAVNRQLLEHIDFQQKSLALRLLPPQQAPVRLRYEQ